MKKCAYCNKEFEPEFRNQKYCCKDCQKNAANARKRKKYEKIQCQNCGKWFAPSKKTSKFCCDKCRSTYLEKHRKKRQYKTKCAYCGKEIIVSRNPTKKEPLRFCCKEHIDLYRKEHSEQRKCPTCGKLFVPYRSNHIFCSRLCRDIDTLRKVGEGKFKEDFIEHYVKGRAIKNSLTAPHLKISALLEHLNIVHINEKRMGRYVPDIYIEDKNLVIEIMGQYWHVDRRKYNDYKKLKYNQRKVIDKDKRRNNFFREQLGIQILYLWEDDVDNNIDLCEALIKRFINNPYKLPSYHSSHYNFNKGKLRYSKKNINQYIED